MDLVLQGKAVEVLNQIVRTFARVEVTALPMNSGTPAGSAGGTVMHPSIPDHHTVLECHFM